MSLISAKVVVAVVVVSFIHQHLVAVAACDDFSLLKMKSVGIKRESRQGRPQAARGVTHTQCCTCSAQQREGDTERGRETEEARPN